MRQYEFVVLYHPDVEIDIDKAIKKVEKVITDNGGKILNSEKWDKKRLAYEIKGNEYAIYVYSDIELPVDKIGKVESVLNITSEVIRYLITTPVPEVPEDDKDDSEATGKGKEKAKAKAKPKDEESKEPKASKEKEE